jgi:hypothetical protein
MAWLAASRKAGPTPALSGLLRIVGRDGVEIIVGRRFRLSRVNRSEAMKKAGILRNAAHKLDWVFRDDGEAIEKASELVDERPVELWCGGRFVIRLEPGVGKLRTQ